MVHINLTDQGLNGQDLAGRPQTRICEKPEYRVYFALIFPFSLVAVLLGRITPSRRAGGPFCGQRRGKSPSIIAEALEMSRAVVPFVFMGR